MPTYDYRCTSCDHRFELFQPMSESPRRKCPRCGRNALERLIGTGAAVLFKGSGFYQTDYRSESYKKAAEAETKAATPASANGQAPAKEPAKAADGASKPQPPAQPAPTPPTPAPPAAKPRPARATKPAPRRRR